MTDRSGISRAHALLNSRTHALPTYTCTKVKQMKPANQMSITAAAYLHLARRSLPKTCSLFVAFQVASFVLGTRAL